MNIENMLLICSDYYYLQKNDIYNINEKGFYKVAWPDVDLKKKLHTLLADKGLANTISPKLLAVFMTT